MRGFEKGKVAFDAHQEARTRVGMRTRLLFRNLDDLSEVILLFEVSDQKKVREFAASADLQQVMRESGVTNQPDVYFLE